MTAAEALFNRQYLLVQEIPGPYQEWAATDVGGGWICLTNNLPTAVVRSSRGCVVLLGEALDPADETATNADLAGRLLDSASAAQGQEAFRRIETATDSLAGRWVLVVHLDGRTSVYPDAFGTRSTVYTAPSIHPRCVASQPQTIAEIVGRPRMPYASTLTFRGAVGWPGTLTPFEEIKRLLPNTCLDLESWTCRRFWPRSKPRAARSLGEVAESLAAALVGVARSASARWPLKIGLTAGYDSRITLASVVAAGVDAASFFTLDRGADPEYDLEVAIELARLTGVQFDVVTSKGLTLDVDPILAVMRRNCSDMGGVGRKAVLYGTQVEESEMLIISHLEQVFKRSFEADDTLEALRADYEKKEARDYGEGRDLAMAEFDGWLATLPASLPSDKRDFLAWEMQWGTWIPNKYVVIDTVAPVMAFQNCRDLQMLGLGLPQQDRLAPYPLLRETLRQLAPAVLEAPFNAPL